MASVANIVRFLPASGSTGDFVYSSGVTGYRTPVSSPALTDGATYRYRAESSDLSEWEIGEGTWTTSTTTLARTTIIHSSTGAKVNFTTAPNVAIVALADQFINPAGDTMTGSLIVPNAAGLKIKDTDASHTLGLVGGSNLTADRTLTLTTGDANRALTLTADSSVGGTAYVEGGTDVALADGGTGASLTDPNADRIMFWDDSAGAVTWLAPGAGLSINGTTIDASGMSAASQAEMEAASSTSVAVSPGRMVNHPLMIKASVAFTYSHSSSHSAISSVDTGTDVVTTSAAHNLSSGDSVMVSLTATSPGGWVGHLFVCVLSSTTFSVHTTYADALAGTNKVDLTSAGGGTRTLYRFNPVVTHTSGCLANCPVGPKPGSAWTGSGGVYWGEMRMYFAAALSAASGATALASTFTRGWGSGSGGLSQPYLASYPVTATSYMDWYIGGKYFSGSTLTANTINTDIDDPAFCHQALVFGDM